jgi:hypothetical protein
LNKSILAGSDLLIDLNDSGLTFDENADYLAEFGKY